ncbi:MAG: DNA cytosine methyltransferase [Planctomycetota bacterium]
MRYLSVCSGIEAASVAWTPLGWSPVAFSEIEPFPCAVLAHHYPDVPNLGDMTTIARRILNGEVEAPDVLAGGTPCQAFSVAGLRKSLADERGNLTLKFVEIADAIDFVRVRDGRPPAIVFWENVPGVLSTKDNAFGCFLGALAGEDCELKPPGKRWADAGCVFGPQRAIAWRVLDAQYFGLAQRRRRVFVVASAREWFDPAAVLFEFDGVRRDSAPSRATGKDTSGSTGDGLARCITAGEMKRQDWETCTMIAHTLRGEGFDASEDGTGRGTPLVPVGVTIHGTDPTVQKVASYDDVAQCLRARTPGNIDNSSTTVVQQPVVFAIQAGALRTNPNSGPDGVGVQADHAYTLEARAEVQAVAVALRGREGGATIEMGDDLAFALRASSGGGDKPHVLAFHENQRAEITLNETAGALGVGGGKPGQGYPAAFIGQAVRRLTPRECERLQGFPDDYTAIPWRGKPASECPDGPRYKALGNSWAVPVVRWIGERISAAAAIGESDE